VVLRQKKYHLFEFHMQNQIVTMVRPTAIRIHSEIRTQHLDTANFFMDDTLPCCCIKFGAQIHQTFGYQGTTLKSMSSAGLIKW
jgi:hypothetical protein